MTLICHNEDERNVDQLSLCKGTVFLLDTNVVSELRKNRPHESVAAWFGAVADHELHISVVTLAQIQAGIVMTREQDADKAADIEIWVNQVSVTYNV